MEFNLEMSKGTTNNVIITYWSDENVTTPGSLLITVGGSSKGPIPVEIKKNQQFVIINLIEDYHIDPGYVVLVEVELIDHDNLYKATKSKYYQN